MLTGNFHLERKCLITNKDRGAMLHNNFSSNGKAHVKNRKASAVIFLTCFTTLKTTDVTGQNKLKRKKGLNIQNLKNTSR